MLGGGYSLAAVLGDYHLLSVCDPKRQSSGNYVYASGTMTGTPIAAAAGLATLRVLKNPGFYDRLNEGASVLQKGLQKVADDIGVCVRIVRIGSLMQFVFNAPAALTKQNDFADVNTEAAQRFAFEAWARGVYILPHCKLYFSSAHTSSDVEETINRLSDAFKAIFDDGI